MRELELVGGCHFSEVGLLGVVSFVLMLKEGMFCLIFQFCIMGDLIFSGMTTLSLRLFAGY